MPAIRQLGPLSGMALALVVGLRWYLRKRSASSLMHGSRATSTSLDPLVVIVGLGGVGSHAAQLLFRGGIRRIRLIDFDQVTLSSLNRHATATRSDVGTPKAVALRAQLLRIDPQAEVEACVHIFKAKFAASLLCGSPALVIDAIDDLATKAELVQVRPVPCRSAHLVTSVSNECLPEVCSFAPSFAWTSTSR